MQAQSGATSRSWTAGSPRRPGSTRKSRRNPRLLSCLTRTPVGRGRVAAPKTLSARQTSRQLRRWPLRSDQCRSASSCSSGCGCAPPARGSRPASARRSGAAARRRRGCWRPGPARGSGGATCARCCRCCSATAPRASASTPSCAGRWRSARTPARRRSSRPRTRPRTGSTSCRPWQTTSARGTSASPCATWTARPRRRRSTGRPARRWWRAS
mmetsp:Transcript_13348/g.41187  ORF Transcript_13348/g.41187 Transcript_13348/m.41187 type:complete len:213 (-) Transcript_13348:158-796(-)